MDVTSLPLVNDIVSALMQRLQASISFGSHAAYSFATTICDDGHGVVLVHHVHDNGEHLVEGGDLLLAAETQCNVVASTWPP